jgi:hypothetical protein
VKEIEITVQFVQKMFVTGDIKFLEREWDDEQIVNVSVEETGKHL